MTTENKPSGLLLHAVAVLIQLVVMLGAMASAFADMKSDNAVMRERVLTISHHVEKLEMQIEVIRKFQSGAK